MSEQKTSATHLAVDATEKAILSAILGGGKPVLEEVLDDGLDADDFGTTANRLIFTTLCDLLDDDRGLDVLGVVDALEDKGQIDEVGGRAAVSQLEAMMGDPIAVGRHAERVRERAAKRRLLKVSRWIAEEACTTDTPAEVLKAQALELIGAVFASETSHTVDRVATLQAVLDDINNPQRRRGCPTGFAKLDALLGPLCAGDLVILAARPAMGKTALVLNIAQAIAEWGAPVGILSCEMSADSLFRRSISSTSRVSMPPDKTVFSPGELRDIQTAAGHLAELPIAVDERAGLTIDQVLSSIAKLVSDGAEAIAIDYLGLINPSRNAAKGRSKADEVAEITKSIKGAAKKHKIPILLLCQLNRSVESRPDKRPMMSDLRDSGAIEQDADKILFLYREEYYLREKCPVEFEGVAEVIVSKNRTGPTGRAFLRYHDGLSLFEDMPAASHE